MSIKSIYVISEQISALTNLCYGAKKISEKVVAVTFGNEDFAKSAAICGADSMIYCPMTEDNSAEDFAESIAEEIKKDEKAFVFVENTIIGRSLAAKLGVYLDTAVFSNVNGLEANEDSLSCNRTVYGGIANRKFTFTSAYGVVTINEGTFEEGEALAATTSFVAMENVAANLKRIAKLDKTETAVNLAVAKRILDVGRGLAKEEDLEICRKFASLIDAEVGCSRPVAENNKWLPKANYMGITGVQVKPELLIALGVSGQVQHMGGINKSKIIVAINKDKAAPIFKSCDFGLVGDMYKILPQLIKKLS